MSLDVVQPSQLFISTEKLARVATWFDPARLVEREPLPVKRLGDDVIFTDGHTRAFLSFRHGLSRVWVSWDEDDLDWDAYAVCVDWCKAAGITRVAHLENRLLSPEDYAVQWIARCQCIFHNKP